MNVVWGNGGITDINDGEKMIKLSKKVENGILALQYIASNNGKLVSAKEISGNLNLTFVFTSKILQALKNKGIIESHQGKTGGYFLTKEPTDISIGEIINALENKDFLSVVECSHNESDETCGRAKSCTIKHTMGNLQEQINSIVNDTSLESFGMLKLES